MSLLPHTVQKYVFFPVFLFLYLGGSLIWIAFHTVHQYSPVWLFILPFMWFLGVDPLPHRAQTYEFSLLWFFIWCFVVLKAICIPNFILIARNNLYHQFIFHLVADLSSHTKVTLWNLDWRPVLCWSSPWLKKFLSIFIRFYFLLKKKQATFELRLQSWWD